MELLTLGTSIYKKDGTRNGLFRDWRESGVGEFPDRQGTFSNHNSLIKKKLDDLGSVPIWGIGHVKDDPARNVCLLLIKAKRFDGRKFAFTYDFVKELPGITTKDVHTNMLVDYIDVENVETHIPHPPVSRKKMFVIMKFDDKQLDSTYQLVIRETARSKGFDVVRIDEIEDSGNITDQIMENIRASDVVFADLTGERPNCYFELGYAMALGKEVILSVKEGAAVHFDVRAYRFIVWDTDIYLKERLEKRLELIRNG